MIIGNASQRRSFSLRLATASVGLIVLVTSVVVSISASATTPLPVLRANFRCAPGSHIPSLKPGQSGSVTATYGGVTATFRSTMPTTAAGNGLQVGMPFNGALTLQQGGQRWTLPRPWNPYVSQMNALCVIAFRSERHPGVMIEGFTGGAHCCEQPVIYLYDRSDSRYDKVVDMSPIDFQNPHAYDANGGFNPAVVGKRVLLKTRDDQFDYVFGCYACGLDPVVLDSVGLDGLTNVTGQHPLAVRADARAIWKYAVRALAAEKDPLQRTPAPFALLAPWVADECTLGRGASAWSTIERLHREGKLSDAYYAQETLNHGSFVAALHTFLLHNDYCIGQI